MIVLFWPIMSRSEIFIAPLHRYSLDDYENFAGHEGFHPFICEFGYRTLADHVIDFNNVYFDPSLVKTGDVIYLGAWFLDWFTNEIHDRIPNPYILLTCDVGGYLPDPAVAKLAYDPKVAYWFAKNMLFTNHGKLFQLPMGQFYFSWASAINPIIDKLHQISFNPTPPKDILLYLNHTERNHGRRIEVANKFWNQPFCFNRNRPRSVVSFEEFWKEISRSKFVLSPLGLEVDCTRTWECFVLNAIPIVEHSYLDPLYEELPILLIHDWNQITESFLHEEYEKINKKSYKLEKAYLNYWEELIKEKQRIVRSGDMEASALEKNNFTKEDIETFQNILGEAGKSDSPLIIRGNNTMLRPFQIASACPTMEKIEVFDLWSAHNLKYLKQFCIDKSLMNNDRIKIHDSDLIHYSDLIYLSFCNRSKNKTYFLDLTHFRHSLFVSLGELPDFAHNLENNIRDIFINLSEGDLLIGNMYSDPYVKEVIENLRLSINISTQGNFFYILI